MTAVWTLLVGFIAAIVVWWWSHRSLSSATGASIAIVLAGIATAFNVVVPIPNVEITTTVVVCAAIVLGARFGAAIGALAVIGTGFAAGIGPWTAWQIAAFGIVAAIVSMTVGRFTNPMEGFHRWVLVLTVFCTTILYDAIVTVQSVRSTGIGVNSTEIAVALLIGAPYTLVHLIATIGLTLLVGPSLVLSLQRAAPRIQANARLPANVKRASR